MGKLFNGVDCHEINVDLSLREDSDIEAERFAIYKGISSLRSMICTPRASQDEGCQQSAFGLELNHGVDPFRS